MVTPRLASSLQTAHSTRGTSTVPGGLTEEQRIDARILELHIDCARLDEERAATKANRSKTYAFRKREDARLNAEIEKRSRTIIELHRRLKARKEAEQVKTETPLQTLGRATGNGALAAMAGLLRELEQYDLATRCSRESEHRRVFFGFPSPDPDLFDDVKAWIASEEDNS